METKKKQDSFSKKKRRVSGPKINIIDQDLTFHNILERRLYWM